MIEKLEQANSVVNYLSDVLGKMGKERKELYEILSLYKKT